MKKTLLLLAAVGLLSTGVNAQNNKRMSAYTYYKNYMRDPQNDGGDLLKAKEAIDAALQHEQTANQSRTFYYEGLIYEAIAKDTSDMFKAMNNDALFTAIDAFDNALKVADKKTKTGEIEFKIMVLIGDVANKAYTANDQKNYSEAAMYFDKAFELAQQKLNRVDTINAWYGGMMAENAKEYELSAELYQTCVDLGFKKDTAYYTLGELYETMGDTVKAIETYKAGTAKYPYNTGMLNQMINIYLKQGKSEEAKETLLAAIEEQPENPTYHFVLGTMYENTGATEEALAEYMAAVELKEDYADAWYNYGAIFVNQGVALTNQMNELPMDAVEEYGKLEAERKELYLKAIPALEKSYQYAPEDLAIVQTLYQLYIKTGNNEKAAEMKAVLDGGE